MSSDTSTFDQRIARFFCRVPGSGAIEPTAEDLNRVGIVRLSSMACEHRLLQLLYWVLEDTKLLSRVPGQERSQLAEAYQTGLGRWRSMAHQLCALRDGFGMAGIPFILLKGYAFDDTYPCLGCVQQGDFDVLINPSDLEGALHLLEKLDYARVARPWEGEYRYRAHGKLSVDLHVSHLQKPGEFGQGKPAWDRVWKRAGSMKVEGAEVPVLHPVDHAAFLLSHTALHHNFMPFSKVTACWNYLVQRQEAISPDELDQTLKEMGMGRLGWFTMNVMQRLTGYPFKHFESLPVPLRVERGLHQMLMRSRAGYFEPQTLIRMSRQCGDGFRQSLYWDSPAAKMRCWRQGLRYRMRRVSASVGAP